MREILLTRCSFLSALFFIPRGSIITNCSLATAIKEIAKFGTRKSTWTRFIAMTWVSRLMASWDISILVRTKSFLLRLGWFVYEQLTSSVVWISEKAFSLTYGPDAVTVLLTSDFSYGFQFSILLLVCWHLVVIYVVQLLPVVPIWYKERIYNIHIPLCIILLTIGSCPASRYILP